MAVTRRTFVKIGLVAGGTAIAGGGAVKAATWAPEAELYSGRMGSGMSKVLVTYATKSGSVAGIAETIGKALADTGAMVDVKPVGDHPNPGDYDAVVVGSGVRVGSWHQPAKDWVKANDYTLKGIPVALFTVGLTITEAGKDAEVRAYTDPLIAETGIKPLDVGLFAGWFEPKRFGLAERLIMKAMKAPEGDHRDMAAVAEWARAVAPRLSA